MTIAFGAIALASPSARADDDAIPNVLPPTDHGARTLRGHTYVEPATQDTPFITSHVGVRQGLGYFFLPDYPVSADRKTNLVLFALTERVDLQVRLLPWLAIWGAGEASLATGLDQDSLFYGNSAFLGGGRGGGAIRLYRSRERGTQVTVRGYFGGAAGNELALPGFVQAIGVRATREVATGTVDDAEKRVVSAVNDLSNAAVADTSQVQFGGSAHFAQTLVRMVGLQTSFALARRNAKDERFEPSAQERLVTHTGDTSMRFAVAVSVDGYHLRVPVALLFEYAVEKTFRVVADEHVYVPSAHLAGFGVFYSGRTDLQLGVSLFGRRNLKALEATALDGTKAVTGVPTEAFAQFVLRYVWN